MSDYTLPSCSSLKRVENCAASEFIKVRIHDPQGEPAERGNDIHIAIADVKDRGIPLKEAIKKASANSQHTIANLEFDKIAQGFTSPRYEVAYALDIATELQRELGVYLERKYPWTKPTEVRGSLDIEGMRGSIPVVQDVKTGQHQGPVQDQVQMRFFSTVLMLKHGTATCRGEINYIQDDGKVEVEGHTFDSSDIDVTIEWLNNIRNKVIASSSRYEFHGELNVYPGDWCHYCPSFEVCPSNTSLVPLLAPRIKSLDSSKLEELSEEELSAAYLLFAEIDPVFTRVKKRMKQIIYQRGIDHPDGSYTRAFLKTNQKVNEKKLMQLTRQYGASELEIATATYTNEYPVIHTYKAPKKKNNA